MIGLSPADFIVIVLYVALMLGIGYWSMRRIKNQEDFFMGGRSFGKLLQVFAMFGSGTSTDSPVGTARNTFVGGLSGIWTVLNYLFCTPFYWFIGLWYRRYRMMTMGDFFEERYQSRSMAGMYAIFGLFFFIVWLSVGFSAASKTILALTPKPAQELSVQQTRELGLFNRMIELEGRDYKLLSAEEKEELGNIREIKPRGRFSYLSGPALIIGIGLVVLLYSWAGGLTAAYLTDLVQGIFIILLSFILIPFGLNQISARFGGQGMMDGFRLMHEKIPEEFFDILGSPSASDFTWYYLLAVTLINLVGIVVQPHMIVVGGGSAKDELSARIGIMVGNFIKRFLTILWTLTGLVALALYAGQIADPDLVWGHATLDLLGPLGLGLVGLMITALMAALMSSASCYILVASSLLVRNLYSWVRPDLSESHYVLVGRICSALAISGGVFFSIYYYDVFDQLKVAWELPVIFAATVWVAMYWRRASRAAAWVAIIVSAALFFLVPILMPVVYPSLRTNEKYLAATQTTEITRQYRAREFDIQRRNREIELWEKLEAQGLAETPRPADLEIGQMIEITTKPPAKSIYWTKGIKVDSQGNRSGQGFFNLEMIFLDRLGFDLSKFANPMIETLRLPFRIVLPIFLMILFSIFTRPVQSGILDRFYVKMKTPVQPDLEKDRRELEKSFENPTRFDNQKIFRSTQLEFTRWNKEDLVGFLLGVLGTILVIALTLWMAGIGA
ncbi:MAG: sodium:solute symporter family protein [Candidatus Glassbacteria bacterium]|nr:sodium:solute symporter family protein [Candidatus Glassbacteria bacterium]